MGESETRPIPERERTDASLEVERRKSDLELAAASGSAEATADDLVVQARARADEVLRQARALADEKAAKDPALRAAQIEAHHREDEALSTERADADDALSHERQERERALRDLLRFEREATDEQLLSERRRADSEVAARDDFMAMASHDLRNLLGGIALNAALLKKEPHADGPAGPVAKRADSIQRLTARMNRLLGDLLDVVSIEAGRLSIAASDQDAGAVLHETAEAFNAAAAARHLTLAAEVASGPLHATFDYDRILQVLANLVSNALKFSPEGGRVLLRAEPAGQEVRLSVIDTGCGIPESLRESVFGRFAQAKVYDRRGYGLGLYISRCLVEAHGGRIWIESTSAQGSTFCLTLPAANSRPA